MQLEKVSGSSSNAVARITLVLMAVLTIVLAGCSSSGNNKQNQRQLTEQQYYEDAQKAMKSNNYLLAIEQLQQLESRFPFGRFAEQAQLDLIFAYYKSLDYGSSAAQAERFIRQYPDHEEIDYAYYMRGLASYSIDRGLLSRFLPTDPSERDMAPARSAFEQFKQFVEKFPDSEYAHDARQRMLYLKNLLADHEIKVANYYVKRKAYLAAANRGRYVVEHFQGTPAVPEALAMMVQAYTNLGITDLAEESETILAQNFPDYPELENGKLAFKKEVLNEDRSWLNIMTFGLIGS